MFLNFNQNPVRPSSSPFNTTKKIESPKFSSGTIKTFDSITHNFQLNHTEEFGKRCQALIGGYNYKVLQNIIEHKAFEDLKSFQDSKPSVRSGSIKIFSYRPKQTAGLSKYECVWYKFKSPEVIDGTLKIPKVNSPVNPEKILELAFNKAKFLVPKSAAILAAKGYKFNFMSEDMQRGDRWISSDISITIKKDKSINIKTPILQTNKFVPIFGGMTYCKVFTPIDAAKIIAKLAKQVN